MHPNVRRGRCRGGNSPAGGRAPRRPITGLRNQFDSRGTAGMRAHSPKASPSETWTRFRIWMKRRGADCVRYRPGRSQRKAPTAVRSASAHRPRGGCRCLFPQRSKNMFHGSTSGPSRSPSTVANWSISRIRWPHFTVATAGRVRTKKTRIDGAGPRVSLMAKRNER